MIVIGGEALVDLVPDVATAEGELGPLHPRLGGGPYNVAIALGRLGIPAGFYARISTDQFGDKLLERLRFSNVDTTLVQRGGEPTTLAIVGLGADGSARYSFHTAGTSSRFVEDIGELPAETTALSLGTLGMVLEPGATVYETVLLREAARGRFIALDPNIRPDLIEDPEVYRKRFTGWLPSIGLLKLSVEDAQWLAGDEDLVVALRRWQAAGPAGVILTRGAAGLAALDSTGQLVEIEGVAAEVADTIGAGDTVQAALLAWLHDHDALSLAALGRLSRQDWVAALWFAARAAAVTVSRPGAQPPYRSELTRSHTETDWTETETGWTETETGWAQTETGWTETETGWTETETGT